MVSKEIQTFLMEGLKWTDKAGNESNIYIKV